MSNGTDFYTVLGVNRDATANDIRNAYLKLCKQLHPDANPQNASEHTTRRFQEINEAYSVLSNVIKRREYDSGRMNPTGYRTSYNYGGYYKPQYHRPYDDYTERQNYYQQDPGYQSEYERIRRHEEGIRTGRIKPVRTKLSVFGIIFGIIVVGIGINIIRAISISKLLNSDRELSTQQLVEYRKLQNEKFDGITSEERVRQANKSMKPFDK